MFWFVLWLASMLAVCGFAFWKGGAPERVVAAALQAGWLGTYLLANHANLADPQWGVLAVDVAFLAVVLYVALTADRIWPLFAAAFQLLGIVIHLAISVDTDIRLLAYLRGLMIWSYLVLWSLALGSYLHWRRERATGARA